MSGIVNKERGAAAAHSSSFSPFPFFLILKNTEKIVFVHDLKRGARGEILDASWISIKFWFRSVLFVCFEFVAVKQEI
jgi:hypothetical protein